MQISPLIQRYLSLKMCKICKWDYWWCHTLNPVRYQVLHILSHVLMELSVLKFAAEINETWQANTCSFTWYTPMAIKKLCSHGNSLFSSHNPIDFNSKKLFFLHADYLALIHVGKMQISSQYNFFNFTLTVMTQMVHIVWTAAAFSKKDIVDGKNDLVSGKNSNIEPILLWHFCQLTECINSINHWLLVKVKVHVNSACEPIVAHQARAYLGFYSMKRLGVFLLPPGWDASPSQGYPPALSSPVTISTPGWTEALW